MLSSERIYLRPIESDDTDNILKWRNHPEIRRDLFSSEPVTREGHLQWLQKLIVSTERKEFIIIRKDGNTSIGTVGLSSIDFQNQKAELGIMIGETSEWGKGFATEACRLLLRFAFQELKFNKVYLRVFEENAAAVKLYEKLGFSKEGLLKEEIKKDGTYRNIFYMSFLKKDWIPDD